MSHHQQARRHKVFKSLDDALDEVCSLRLDMDELMDDIKEKQQDNNEWLATMATEFQNILLRMPGKRSSSGSKEDDVGAPSPQVSRASPSDHVGQERQPISDQHPSPAEHDAEKDTRDEGQQPQKGEATQEEPLLSNPPSVELLQKNNQSTKKASKRKSKSKIVENFAENAHMKQQEILQEQQAQQQSGSNSAGPAPRLVVAHHGMHTSLVPAATPLLVSSQPSIAKEHGPISGGDFCVVPHAASGSAIFDQLSGSLRNNGNAPVVLEGSASQYGCVTGVSWRQALNIQHDEPLQEEGEAQEKEEDKLWKDCQKLLSSVTRNELAELKAIRSPPFSVRLVGEALSLLLAVAGGNTTSAHPKSLSQAAKNPYNHLWDRGVLESLKKLNEKANTAADDDVEATFTPMSALKLRTEFIDNEQFNPKLVSSASIGAGKLCAWCHAAYRYLRATKLRAGDVSKLDEVHDLPVVDTEKQHSKDNNKASASRAVTVLTVGAARRDLEAPRDCTHHAWALPAVVLQGTTIAPPSSQHVGDGNNDEDQGGAVPPYGVHQQQQDSQRRAGGVEKRTGSPLPGEIQAAIHEQRASSPMRMAALREDDFQAIVTNRNIESPTRGRKGTAGAQQNHQQHFSSPLPAAPAVSASRGPNLRSQGTNVGGHRVAPPSREARTAPNTGSNPYQTPRQYQRVKLGFLARTTRDTVINDLAPHSARNTAARLFTPQQPQQHPSSARGATTGETAPSHKVSREVAAGIHQHGRTARQKPQSLKMILAPENYSQRFLQDAAQQSPKQKAILAPATPPNGVDGNAVASSSGVAPLPMIEQAPAAALTMAPDP